MGLTNRITGGTLGRTYWDFGTIIRLEPGQTRYASNLGGRWMVLHRATMGRSWAVLDLGTKRVLRLESMTGFERVDE